MHNFSQFLRVTFFFCFMVLLHQGPLYAQYAYVSGYDENTSQDFGYEMIWNGSEFTYYGFFGGYVSFFSEDLPNGANLSYPGGNIYENWDQSIIPSGLYTLMVNTETGDYVFESSNTCYGSSNQASLQVYGFTPLQFCDSGTLYASITIDQIVYTSFGNLDFQWLRNGVPIPGANEMVLENVYLSSIEPEVFSLLAICQLNNDTLVSNEWVAASPTFTLEIDNYVQPIVCQPFDLHSNFYMNGVVTEYTSNNIDYQWIRNGIPISSQGLSETSWNFDVSAPAGWTESLGAGNNRYFSGQSGQACRLDVSGDFVMFQLAEELGSISYYLKGQNSGGPWQGTFTLEESADGITFTPLHTFSGAQLPSTSFTLFTDNPAAATRYIRWYFTEKVTGNNVALDEITVITNVAGLDLSNVTPSASETFVFTLQATCASNGATLVSNEVSVPACYSDSSSPIDYLLVQNVTTTGNIPGQSVQVQFDLKWGNTWKDDVNWDAVWVFMKYKDAQGIWKHCKVSPTGYDHGQGTPNIIEPTADQMGAFVSLSAEGQGDFNVDAMQLRWNYGADGLSSVSGLEVRVYAIEMVYTPQGDFSVTNGPAPGGKTPVINTRLSPPLNLWGTMRVKGDAGLDTDANGSVDNTIYPTGYYPFYMFKYEMSDQQYADFLNCLTPAQRTALGWGGTITETAGQYFAAAPNRACDFSNTQRLLAYSDWAGLRPLSYLEFEKGFHGPKPPQNPEGGRGCCGDASGNSGSGVYGAKDMTGNVREPIVIMTSNTFDRNIHGNGILSASGPSDVISWSSLGIDWLGYGPWWSDSEGRLGFRLCRTAE